VITSIFKIFVFKTLSYKLILLFSIDESFLYNNSKNLNDKVKKYNEDMDTENVQTTEKFFEDAVQVSSYGWRETSVDIK